MAYASPREVVASAARTTSADSGTLAIGSPSGSVNILVDCTAASGTTPTLDFSIEWSHDGGTTFAAGDTADSFAQITAVKKTVKQFAAKAPTYRVKWAIGGASPSFTFSVREFLT